MAEGPRTIRQAAAELNVSEFTIRAWVGQRRIAHVRLGRCIRIPAAELRRLRSMTATGPLNGSEAELAPRWWKLSTPSLSPALHQMALPARRTEREP
jgi:excisionase family DNA binding protein